MWRRISGRRNTHRSVFPEVVPRQVEGTDGFHFLLLQRQTDGFDACRPRRNDSE